MYYEADSEKGKKCMRNVTVAAVQMRCNATREENINRAERLVREAAKSGAQVILLPELFETWYFCQERNYDTYQLATPVEENPAILRFRKVAKELSVVLPISFFERAGQVTYNSIAMIDADGEVLGVYRKTHIPDDHFYQEKFHFTPGNTGFKVWDTAYGKLGVGICWDQWFPEAARCMALDGAEILLYPTAIGTEPILSCDSMPHWRRCMQGHSASNVVPVVAANRIGKETVEPSEANNHQSSELMFYGSSFITDEVGALMEQMDRDVEGFVVATFNLDAIADMRASWGLFRDRRPECYRKIAK